MPYCDIDDLKVHNPKRTYSANTTPTEDQVNELIDQVAADIDNALQSQGYTVPATSPANFVEHLKWVNAMGAAALAEMGMFPESQVGATPHGNALYKVYKDKLDALRRGEIPAELAPGSSSSPVGSYYTDVADQSAYPDPAFRKSSNDMEF